LRAAFRAGGSVWGFACMHRERGIVATRLRMRDCLPRWRRILPKACVPHCCSSIHAVATRRTMRRVRTDRARRRFVDRRNDPGRGALDCRNLRSGRPARVARGGAVGRRATVGA
jgi:hypothetical protein